MRNDEVYEGILTCPNNHSFPIENFIPDFVQENKDHSRDMIYDEIWGLHKEIPYFERDIPQYIEKFQTFANFPNHVGTYIQNKMVLDAGCGAGRFSYLSSSLKADFVVSVDFSKYALTKSLYKTGNPKNISFLRADLNTLPFRSRLFDFVFSYGVLHHTPNPYGAFQKLTHLLKQDAYMSIYVYRKNSLSIIQNLLRPLSLRSNRKHVLSFCKKFGFAYDYKDAIVLNIRNLFGYLGRLDILRVKNMSYEGLTTPYLYSYKLEEIKKWFKKNNFSIISSSQQLSMTGRLLELPTTTKLQ